MTCTDGSFVEVRRALSDRSDVWSIDHVDITCDGCEIEPIRGSRYKCTVCSDIDLCERCMRAIVTARLKMASEDVVLQTPKQQGKRARRWVSKLHSKHSKEKWTALLQAVPCLHTSHKFTKIDSGPERAVVFHGNVQHNIQGEVLECDTTMMQRDFQHFLSTFPPSKALCSDLAWIVVTGKSSTEELGSSHGTDLAQIEERVENALEDWEHLTAPDQPLPTAFDVEMLARKHDIRVGKWMVFPHADEADAAWEAVARAVYFDGMTDQAKISTVDPSKTDHDVERVRLRLQQALPTLKNRKLLYKPDILTYLGIYSKNKYNLRPTVYISTL